MSTLLTSSILWLTIFILGIFLGLNPMYTMGALIISSVYNAAYILKGELNESNTDNK